MLLVVYGLLIMLDFLSNGLMFSEGLDENGLF